MFRATLRPFAVFTPAFESLKPLQDALLPSHPLSQVPLWLAEEDIILIQEKFQHSNTPWDRPAQNKLYQETMVGANNTNYNNNHHSVKVTPLKIDFYAHHPIFSRYSSIRKHFEEQTEEGKTLIKALEEYCPVQPQNIKNRKLLSTSELQGKFLTLPDELFQPPENKNKRKKTTKTDEQTEKEFSQRLSQLLTEIHRGITGDPSVSSHGTFMTFEVREKIIRFHFFMYVEKNYTIYKKLADAEIEKMRQEQVKANKKMETKQKTTKQKKKHETKKPNRSIAYLLPDGVTPNQKQSNVLQHFQEFFALREKLLRRFHHYGQTMFYNPFPFTTVRLYSQLYLYNASQMTCQTPEEAAQYARYTTKTDTSQYTHQQQNDIQNNYYNEEGEEDTYIASLLLQEAAEGQDGSEHKVQPTRILTPGMQDGVRLLRSLLPPPSMKGHFSISSGKSYKSNMVQGEMELCRLRCHYHSPWWGTLTSFKKKYNAVPLPGEKEHVFFMKKNTKVYHISYFYNAEEILKYLFITPKNGRVHLNARDYFAKEENKLFYSSSELQTVSHFFAAEQAALLSSSSLPTESAWGDGFSTFLAGITEYSRIHQYQIPLFFSVSLLRRLGLSLKATATGWEARKSPGQLETGNSLLLSSDHHNNNEENNPHDLDHAALLEVQRLNARNEKNANTTKKRSLPILGVNRFENEESNNNNNNSNGGQPQYFYFYHLSQVHFPENYKLPTELLVSELSRPYGVPLHGCTGQPLNFPELAADRYQLSKFKNNNENNNNETKSVSFHDDYNANAEHNEEWIQLFQNINDQSELGNLFHLHNNNHHNNVEEETTNKPLGDLLDEAYHNNNNNNENKDNNDQTLRFTAKSRANLLGKSNLRQYIQLYASPKRTKGRNIWFSAEDVLKNDGVVDVNACPVHVVVRNETNPLNKQVGWFNRFTPDGDTVSMEALPPQMLFNVECLTKPEEGLKFVCNKYLHFQ